MRSHLIRVLVVIFFASCGGGGSNPDAQQVAEDAASAQEAATALPFCTDKPALASVTDLSGTWVARVQGAQIVNAAVVGELYTESVFFILMTISQTGTTVVLDGRYCDRVEHDQSKPLVPVVLIPDAWAHTEKPVHRIGSFAPGAGGYSILSLPSATEVAGAVLASPSDPLPTAADYLRDPHDPRIVDEDNDGHPGITIQLTGTSISGQLYSVQRQITSVEAIAVAADRLMGTLDFNSTQNVLDSAPPRLATLYAQPGTSTVPDTTCNSYFAMVRVGDALGVDGGAVDAGFADAGDMDGGAGQGGVISCAWVRENETSMFQ
jgi:hypothetical protein